MMLDAWYLILAAVVGGTAGAIVYVLSVGGPDRLITRDQMASLDQAPYTWHRSPGAVHGGGSCCAPWSSRARS